MRNKINKITFLSLLIIIILNLTFCIVKRAGTIDTLTNRNLLYIKIGITAFYAQMKKLPIDLEELFPNYIEDEMYFIDQWGNKIQYEIQKSKNRLGYKLISYGADNKKGGCWDNQDILIEHFFK